MKRLCADIFTFQGGTGVPPVSARGAFFHRRDACATLGLWLLAALGVVVLLLAGCSQQRGSVADTFPKASQASPWVLQDDVWSGSFAEAAGAFGEESQQWGEFTPEYAWLAIYRHESRPSRKLTVRALAFADAGLARRTFDRFRPADADELQAGDAACWTSDGVLVLWGRMVFDIFVSGSGRNTGPEQAAYLLGFIEKRMPPNLPDDPQ